MSQHFRPIEFACHDGTPYPEKWIDSRLGRLCSLLEKIRGVWGFPLIVISGYRTPVYNERIRGVSKSQHCEGRAADIRPMRVSDVPALLAKVEVLIAKNELGDLGGLGVYPAWLHVDTRPHKDGSVARWQGKGLGSET